MIGQKNLIGRIEHLIDNNNFPRFSIFVGPRGSGKKTLVLYIAKYMKISWAHLLDVKIDTIRDVIVQAYKVSSPIIYLIPDADAMSNAAKNALLKVTEEPPNNAYFIMTLEDENNTLETIRSRGTVFHMDRYTPDEIEEYAVDKAINPYTVSTEDEKEMLPIIRDLCETPGDVNILVKCGVQDFYDYVQLVVDNIAEVSLANAFKIPSKVALKDDAEGYDLRLFWKAFIKIAFDMGRYNGVYATSKYLQKLKTKGINRSMLMDSWVLEIRELWQS